MITHGLRGLFERGCRINGRSGTNVEHSLRNDNIQKHKKSFYLFSHIITQVYTQICISSLKKRKTETPEAGRVTPKYCL